MTKFSELHSPAESIMPWLEKKSIDPSRLEETCASFRAQNLSIASLNGSFDLLHAGHLYMIHQASLQADCLIVALNTDASIKRYKGPERPIVCLRDRLSMMAALEFVDYVTWFDESDPCRILSLIRPDVHVNGAEYGENCIEAETVKRCGGRLHLVKRIPGLATSEIIKTIRGSCD